MPRLTVDPGLAGTGWALWDNKWELIQCGIVTSRKKLTDGKMKDIALNLWDEVAFHPPTMVYIEQPQKFNSAKGDMVANRGDLVKLTRLVGFIEAFFQFRGAQTEMVSIMKWKGQLSKRIVEDRVKRILPKLKAESHAVDAVGIGLYLKGDF